MTTTQFIEKAIPATTAEACAKYHTRRWRCDCPDAQQREGGSYTWNGGAICKHRYAIIKGHVDSNEVRAIEAGITTAEYTAQLARRVEKALGIQKTQAQIETWALLAFIELV